MFRIKKKIITAATLIVCFALIGVAVFIPYQQALVFYKKNTDQLKIYLPLQTGDTFQLIWKHSIHKTDVVEKYQVQDEGMEQFEIVYEHFGIGMPSNATGNEEYVYENGKHHIKNMSNFFPEINWRNGKKVSENRIVWGAPEDEHIAWMNDFVDPGELFTIKIERLSLWERLKGEKIHD